MIDAIEARTREYFELDPLPSHLDYVAAWIEDGHTINDLAGELSHALGFTVHREWIGTYLRRAFAEHAVDERLANARAHASHVLAEVAIGLSDAEAETSVDVARAGLRARTRQWTAERWNPSQYGQSKGVNVAISVTQLHLAALQQYSTTVTGSPQIEPRTSASTSALPLQVEPQQRVS